LKKKKIGPVLTEKGQEEKRKLERLQVLTVIGVTKTKNIAVLCGKTKEKLKAEKREEKKKKGGGTKRGTDREKKQKRGLAEGVGVQD